MKKWKLVALITLGAVLTATAGGAAAWYGLKSRAAAAHAGEPEAAASAASAPVAIDKRPQKYISLDKVIVMLRRGPGDTTTHYLAMDLVLQAAGEEEKITKEHLPMLRSVAVKAMSNYTAEQAGGMTIEQFTEAVNTAYNESYARDKREKPFSEAMIGKLIVE